MKSILVVTLACSMILSVVAVVSAQEEPTVDTATITEEVANEDPGLLPGNPFYFLKEWGRGVQRFFISDPIKQVEFELKITTEKGEELEKVAELNRQEAIEKAFKNYEKAMTALQEKLGELEGLSNNPGANELLQKIAENTERHEELFQNLTIRYETLKGYIQPLQEGWENVVSPLFKNNSGEEQLQNRIMEMTQGGSPGYGVLNQIMERVRQEIIAQPENQAADSSDETVGIGNQINEATEERMQESQSYPMPGLDANKLDSIMLNIRKTLNIGQTKYAVQPEVCADIYIPVCGADEKSYSNECYATRAGVNVAHEGECRE
ncbi:MAG: DUF5667 domain-containing protein [Candidatus Colwellbacteria bacterium]|nr:DUF5667 domain-containing protein [Candidatus Colwellbacteria bacterium]